MREIRQLSDRIAGRIICFVATDKFFCVILVISFLQASWYVFSFHPWINDEARHFADIIVYSHFWSPFLGNQNPAWDHLGPIVRDGSFLFYYLMSFPLRLVNMFTHSQLIQLLFMRYVCVALFISGLVILRKAFLEIGSLSRSIINVLFLSFVLIPAYAILPATVNYDNVVFPLFAVILLLTIRIAKSRKVSYLSLALLLALGTLIVLVKWTAIGLFIPFLVWVAYDQYKKFGVSFPHLVVQSLKRSDRLRVGVATIVLLILTFLFIGRPVANVLQYHTPSPSCPAVIGIDRCMKFADYAAYASLRAQKPNDFHPANPVLYLLEFWMPRMIDTADNLLEKGQQTELPIIIGLYSVLAIGGIVTFMVFFPKITRNRLHAMLAFVSIVYLILLFLDEYGVYVAYGGPAAIRARYLLTVVPVFMFLLGYGYQNVWRRHKVVAVSCAITMLIITTQGGGITTYALTSPERAYWQNQHTIRLNQMLQTALHPLIKE